MSTEEFYNFLRYTNLISIEQVEIVSEYCVQRIIRRAPQYTRFLSIIMQHTNMRVTTHLF